MEAPSDSWKKSLYAIAIAEFIVLVGFNFVSPFMPLFVQQVGAYTDREAALWAGIATGAAGVGGFIAAPIWGLVADRWGRKPMLLRSQMVTAVVVALVGLSPNIYYLVGLRFMQGALSGTVAAASALVASMTPRNRMPFAMGLLLVAIYAGSTIGPLLGGTIADALGFRETFFITGGLVLGGGFIVLFFVEEKFDRANRPPRASLGTVLRLAASGDILPLLIALCMLQAGTQILAPVIPLFIQQIEPEGQAATASGIAFALMGVLAGVSAFVAGRLGARMSLKKIIVYSSIGTALLYLPPLWATTVSQVVFFVILTSLLKGGFMTPANTLVGLSVSGNQQGVAYGMAHSAQALGNGLGPLMGGALAAAFGFKSVFIFAGALFVLVAVLTSKMLAERSITEPGPKIVTR